MSFSLTHLPSEVEGRMASVAQRVSTTLDTNGGIIPLDTNGTLIAREVEIAQ